MLIVHILSSILVGLLTAVWAWLDGASILTVMSCYVLGGNMGLLGTAALLLILPPKGREAESTTCHPAE